MAENVRELIKPWRKIDSIIVITKYKTEEEARQFDPVIWETLKEQFNIEGTKRSTVIGNERMHSTALGENPPKHNEILHGLKEAYPKAKIGYEKNTGAYTIDWT